MTDIKQQIAQAEAKLARLKEKDRKLENGQKIVIGGAVLAEAKDNREFAIQLVELLQSRVTRKTDIDRLSSVIERLNKQIKENNSYPNQPTSEQAMYNELMPNKYSD